MYCGIAPGDSCTEHSECASQDCSKTDGVCYFGSTDPSDTEGMDTTFARLTLGLEIVGGVLLLAIVIGIVWRYRHAHKKNISAV